MRTRLQIQKWMALAALLGANAWALSAAPLAASHRGLQFPSGSTGSLAVRNGYGYVLNAWTRGDGVLVFDLRKPATPHFVQGIPAKGYLRAGSFVDDMLYIPAPYFSVMAVDVSHPGRIQTLRNLFYNFPAGDVQCLAVSGDRLYVGGRGGGLHILDISDPRTPMPTAWNPEFGHLTQIAAEGRRLVLHPQRGETILAEMEGDQITERSRLRLVGNCQWFGNALYEATRRELVVHDLSHLLEPRIATKLPGTSPIGIVSSGKLLMRVPDQKLALFDISNPLDPQRLREISLPPDINLGSTALENGILYAVDNERISVRTYDIAGDSLRPLGEAFIMRNAGHLALGEGKTAFLSTVQGESAMVLSLDTRGNGPVTFSARMQQTLPARESAFTMHDTHRAAATARVGAWLLVGDGVCDLSDPKKLRMLQPTTRMAADIVVRDGLAALAQSDRVTFLDIKKLPERVVLSEFKPDGENTHYTGVALGKNFAYLVNAAKEGTRVEVLDIRNPSAPRLVGHCETPAALKVALDEAAGLLYVPGSTNGGITILDVSAPEAPKLLKTVDGLLDTRCYRIRIHEGRLYFTDSMRGIKVADLEDPLQPKLRQTYMGATTHSASYTDFEIRNNTLYGLRFSHLDIWEME